MIKAHIDLVKNDKLIATLTWHKVDESGKTLDIGFDFTDDIDDELRESVIAACGRPIAVREAGKSTGTAYPGSSRHFEMLPKILERLGCRVRSYY